MMQRLKQITKEKKLEKGTLNVLSLVSLFIYFCLLSFVVALIFNRKHLGLALFLPFLLAFSPERQFSPFPPEEQPHLGTCSYLLFFLGGGGSLLVVILVIVVVVVFVFFSGLILHIHLVFVFFVLCSFLWLLVWVSSLLLSSPSNVVIWGSCSVGSFGFVFCLSCSFFFFSASYVCGWFLMFLLFCYTLCCFGRFSSCFAFLLFQLWLYLWSSSCVCLVLVLSLAFALVFLSRLSLLLFVFSLLWFWFFPSQLEVVAVLASTFRFSETPLLQFFRFFCLGLFWGYVLCCSQNTTKTGVSAFFWHPKTDDLLGPKGRVKCWPR